MEGLKFEFEEREVDGKIYRLPIMNMKKAMFKQIGKTSYKVFKKEDNRYSQAKKIYRNKDLENDEPDTCKPDIPVQEVGEEPDEEAEGDVEDFDDNFFGDDEEKIETEPNVRICF